MDCELPTWMSPSTKALCPEFFIPNYRISEFFLSLHYHEFSNCFSEASLSRIFELSNFFSKSYLSRIIELSNFVFGPTEQREKILAF